MEQERGWKLLLAHVTAWTSRWTDLEGEIGVSDGDDVERGKRRREQRWQATLDKLQRRCLGRIFDRPGEAGHLE